MTASVDDLWIVDFGAPFLSEPAHHLCYVQCELIRSISRRRLVHRLGRVSVDVRRGVDEVVRTLLDH